VPPPELCRVSAARSPVLAKTCSSCPQPFRRSRGFSSPQGRTPGSPSRLLYFSVLLIHTARITLGYLSLHTLDLSLHTIIIYLSRILHLYLCLCRVFVPVYLIVLLLAVVG
jgi:hypothetical protein